MNSIGIIWNHPNKLLSGGIRFYVALARKTNSSSETTGEVVAEHTTAREITGLNGYTEYVVGVVAVDGDGTPFKSEYVLVMTDEGGELLQSYNFSFSFAKLSTGKAIILLMCFAFQFRAEGRVVFE